MRYHLRTWGTPVAGTPPLVLAHGWMDVAASWQFVVDALSDYGVTHMDMPATPEKVWRAIQGSGSKAKRDS